MNSPLRLSVSLAVLLAACGDEVTPDSVTGSDAVEAAGPGGGDWSVWHQDFPFEVHLSPAVDGRWYEATKREALDHVVAHLSGACSPDAWIMAKRFFARAGEEVVPALVAAMDRAVQNRETADMVENLAEAMGHMVGTTSPEMSAALLRALKVPKTSVQNKVMSALSVVGTPDAIRAAGPFVHQLSARARSDWLLAVRRHLPANEVERIYRGLLYSEENASMFPATVDQAVKLEPATAVRLLEPLWEGASGKLRFMIANVLHASGDLRGTRYLLDQLEHGDALAKKTVLSVALLGDVDWLLDQILKLSRDPDAGVRQGVVEVIAGLPGENIDNVLSVLAMDPDVSVRQPALFALGRRGKRDHLDRLVEQVRTATGSKLVSALVDLGSAADASAISAIYERMMKAPEHERRKFIQVIGRSGTPEGFAALKKIFLGPEGPIDRRGERTTLTYVGVLFPNLRGSRRELLDLYHELPSSDYRRRAAVINSLGNLAAVVDDEEFRTSVYDLCREVVQNQDEIPQMRLLALEYLRRDLNLDDMIMITRLQNTEENQTMRRAWTAMLFEFF